MAKRPKRFAEGDQVSDYDSGKSRGSAGTFETVTPSKAKSKIVTKEELEKSGLSLRDYMNKQQGLTRRGDSKAKIDAIIAKGQANNEADRIETEAAEAEPPSTYTNTGSVSRPRVTPDRVKNLASTFKVPMNPRIQRDELGEPLYKKKGGVIKMASGGMTASSRADGCCVKGKTRGKMM